MRLGRDQLNSSLHDYRRRAILISDHISALLDSRYGLIIPLLAGVLTSSSYLITHQFPRRLGGLFLLMGDTILKNGYIFPKTIPQIAEGIPFAYPPIGPYLLAILMDFGFGWKMLTITYPAALTVLAVIPAYLLGSEIFTRRLGAIFATAVVTNPIIFLMNITAGGSIRGVAMIFLLFGLYRGVKLFRDNSRIDIIFSGLLFGMTVMTHLYYAVFFGLSFIALWMYFDQTISGLIRGAAVAVLGTLVVSIWLIPIIQIHGIDVFFRASGRKTGIGPDIGSLGAFLFLIPVEPDFLVIWSPIAILGMIYLLSSRKFLIPLWYTVTAIGFSSFRFLALIYSLAASVFISERSNFLLTERDQGFAPILIIMILTISTASGMAYTAEYPGPLSNFGDDRLTTTITSDDIEAMAWLQNNSSTNSTVLAQGNVAEWIPYHTGVQLINGIWGLEFSSKTKLESYRSRHNEINNCSTPDCINKVMNNTDEEPNYIYLNRPLSVSSFRQSDDFDILFSNDGVIIISPTAKV